jgi:mannose-6-phosphate isomerase-like protein (cupin superfamily)
MSCDINYKRIQTGGLKTAILGRRIMILHKSDAKVRELDKCHDGRGILLCTEMLAEYQRKESGVKFYHDNILQSGGSIGEHLHKNNEELYIILEGAGLMKIDGKDEPVKPGDVCITRKGHSHSLLNSGKAPMHFLVIGVALSQISRPKKQIC